MTVGKAKLAQYGAVTVVAADDDDDKNDDNNSRNNTNNNEAYSFMPTAEATPLTYGAESLGKDHGVELAEHDGASAGPRFRDVPFSLLFFVQLAVAIYVGVTVDSWTVNGGEGGEALEQNQETVVVVKSDGTVDDDAFMPAPSSSYTTTTLPVQRIVVWLVLPSVAISYGLSYVLTAAVVPASPILAVKVCVLSSLAMSCLLALVVILAAPGLISAVIMLFVVGLMIWYIRTVWPLVTFAASNLEAAVAVTSDNCGLYVVALAVTAVMGVWASFWSYMANGVMLYQNQQDKIDATEQQLEDGTYAKVHYGSLFLLLVSLYWTTVVLMNMIQTTVAGVTGTWCFAKEDASSCCSTAVTSSLYRTCTYSFGSICLGSLVEAIGKALRVLAEIAKNQSRDSDDNAGATILFCILECILRIFEDVIEYFNQWAYVFVGIYGYSYVESGRKVMELFRARGWTAIITNDLVGYVLSVAVFVVAVLTGLAAWGIEVWTRPMSPSSSSSSYLFENADNGVSEPAYVYGWVAFFVGFMIGLLVSSVVMNVVKGAVNSVIVCFADAPAKMEEYHPVLVYKMASCWSDVFPECGIRVPPSPKRSGATVVV